MLQPVIPTDIQAEKAVIGAMLAGGSAVLDEVVTVIDDPKAFTKIEHETVFGILVDMARRGESVDLITTCNAARRLGVKPDVAWEDMLMDLCESFADVTAAKHYAAIVADMHARRHMILAAHRLTADCSDPTKDPSDILANHVREVEGHGRRDVEPIDASNLIPDVLKFGHGQMGIMTGLHRWDSAGGIRTGEMTIIAARPSTGKTALGLNLCVQGLGMGVKSLFISVEMTKDRITERLVSIVSGYSMEHIRNRCSPDESRDILSRAQRHVGSKAIYILDSRTRMPEIVAESRRMIRRSGIKLIVVDYLQLCSAGGKYENRNLEVAAMSSDLKRLAVSESVCVVCLSQLNRDASTRAPKMCDLRDSGAIEQDADQVMMLWRDESVSDNKIRVTANLAKNRNGPTLEMILEFDRPCMRFKEKPVVEENN